LRQSSRCNLSVYSFRDSPKRRTARSSRASALVRRGADESSCSTPRESPCIDSRGRLARTRFRARRRLGGGRCPRDRCRRRRRT
jgi:hypothetical protein